MTTSSKPKTLEQAIRSVAEDATPARVHVAAYGRIVAVDRAAQTADVQQIVDSVRVTAAGSKSREPLPVFPDVPIVSMGRSVAALSFPYQVGDLVLLVYRDASHDEIDAQGYPAAGTVEPASLRRFSYSDAIALPIVAGGAATLPASATSTADPVLYLGNSGEVVIGQTPATDRPVLVSELRSYIDDLNTWLTGHSHPESGAPPPPLPAPQPPGSGSIVGSQRIKVDK